MPHRTAQNEKIRNIAIIAHVDHGKTTLVDAMFRQSGLFRDNQDVAERLMDSMDLERERGITIAAKNCSVLWDGVRVNILDTPGHADFGGEVERALSMVDGVILLVDASEGPLPQTRFVLAKALAAGLALVVVINKIDRPDARPQQVLDEVTGLLIDLDANEDQLDFPLLYASGKSGSAKRSLEDNSTDLRPLFETILEEIPAPRFDPKAPFQMLVSDLSYSDYLGRLAIGRIRNGSTVAQSALVRIGRDGAPLPLKVTKLQVYEGPALREIGEVSPGDIIVLSGVEDVSIGDTICEKENPLPLPRIVVDAPTVAMRFTINSSPLAGREGKYVQSRHIRDRLLKETLKNVALQVEDAPDGDGFIVKGRGEFQMAIIVETMRREGFELSVGRPEVIYRYEDGKRLEPIEHVSIDCEEAFSGVVTEKLSMRKAKMTGFVNHGSGRVRLDFSTPSRALIGFRDELLTDTKGTGILHTYFAGYEEYRGTFPVRGNGSLVSDRQGEAVAYAIFHLEPRGRLFVVPGDPVYEGMVVGIHNRDQDLDVNPCRQKKLTNMRASGKDESIILTPVVPLTLENALTSIREDELVEVTPNSFRLRKRILSAQGRKVQAKRER